MKHDPVKAKIVELVPEIVQLKFGCWVKDKDGEAMLMRDYKPCKNTSGHTDMYEGKNERGNTVITFFDEVIGRPITLADVLRAIQGTDRVIGIDYWGRFIGCDENLNNVRMFAEWNLTTDYDNQTQEVRTFIGKLLGVTK